jgi:hypothetical protein
MLPENEREREREQAKSNGGGLMHAMFSSNVNMFTCSQCKNNIKAEGKRS